MTVGRMKIGAKLVFGRYGVRDDTSVPVIWLKATPNGDFITESVLDYLCFDARERQSDDYNNRIYGRPDYDLSNIRAFINSDQQFWWSPTHDDDAPPRGEDISSYRDAYYEHPGFLYEFEDYETGSLVRINDSLIRLPSFEDVLGIDRFQLFSRKGVRAHGSQEFIDNKGFEKGFDSGSFIDFWISGGGGVGIASVSRSGSRRPKTAYSSSGLRPVCTISRDAKVVVDENGIYHLKPYEVQQDVFSDDDFFALLGMARP